MARTRRTAPGAPCRSGSSPRPSGVTTTWALVIWPGSPRPVWSASSVTPTANGTPSLAASAAIASSASLSTNGTSFTSTTFSGHSTRSRFGSGFDRPRRLEVAFEHDPGRHVVRSGPLLAAALHDGDRVRAPGARPLRSDRGEDDHDDDRGERDHAVRRTGGRRPPAADQPRHLRRRAGEREAELEHDPGDEDGTADAGDDEKRTARLGDRHAGQRDATEREREPDDLDERVGGRPADHPPMCRSGDASAARAWALA